MKLGIEQAGVHAAIKPVTVSGGVLSVEEKGERVFEKKIKEGLEMKIPKPGEDMYVFSVWLGKERWRVVVGY